MYVIYKKSSGEILREVRCSPEAVKAQVSDDESYVSGEGSWLTHRVVDGEVVPLDVPRVPPEPWQVFDFDAGEYVDTRSFADTKAAKWVEIKTLRDNAEFGGFVWDGSVFDSDLVSRSRLQGAAQLATIALSAGRDASESWTLADNTSRVLTGSDIVAAAIALGQHVSAIHAYARTLRAQIDAATSSAQLDEISWSFGVTNG